MFGFLVAKLRAVAARRLPQHLRDGRRGEDLAFAYLRNQGYRVVARNFRARGSRGEVVSAFLAVLEMIRLALVRLHQSKGGDILLYRTTRELQKHELEGIQT